MWCPGGPAWRWRLCTAGCRCGSTPTSPPPCTRWPGTRAWCTTSSTPASGHTTLFCDWLMQWKYCVLIGWLPQLPGVRGQHQPGGGPRPVVLGGDGPRADQVEASPGPGAHSDYHLLFADPSSDPFQWFCYFCLFCLPIFSSADWQSLHYSMAQQVYPVKCKTH